PGSILCRRTMVRQFLSDDGRRSSHTPRARGPRIHNCSHGALRRRSSMKFREATSEIVRLLAREAWPVRGDPEDYDPLLDQIGDASYVLIGEASHGTHEFYRERASITQRLIEQKGFVAVAIEGDWPDAYRVNRYVRGLGNDADAEEALRGFQRFPTWMWRNADVLDFV